MHRIKNNKMIDYCIRRKLYPPGSNQDIYCSHFIAIWDYKKLVEMKDNTYSVIQK
jgi:hypothetical protein